MATEKPMIAFTMSRAERRNIIRAMPGGITTNWAKLGRLPMYRRNGAGQIMIGVRVIMPWEGQHA